jgi:hypothetical protein
MSRPRRVLARFGVVLLVAAAAGCDTPPALSTGGAPAGPLAVRVDATAPGEQISPLIRGINGDWTAEEMSDVGITFVSWGGNGATRFNYLIGHAWNTAADWEYRNVNHTGTSGDAFREFVDVNVAAGAETRLAVPAIGWIAKNDDPNTCSFPDGDGGCEPRSADCASPGRIADPRDTSVESTPEMVATWVEGLLADGVDLHMIAMDNEPELWGYTHYDIHPECTTFEEVLATYVTYGRAIREVAADALLAGPVICCWYDYWGPSIGPADGSDLDIVSWFLENVRLADEQFGQRTLDVLDLHYYPQSDGVFDPWNVETAGATDDDTNALRLRSTRSLWDPEYTDESWIGRPVRFIPRMQELIDEHYPGTELAITEWNFGAEETMNGALAIADVLGVYGREGVYAAAYWRSPDPQSTGYFAFKMHGNYDGEGAAFVGAVLPCETSDYDVLGAYAALDEEAGVVRIMLVNKHADEVAVELDVVGLDSSTPAERYTYGDGDQAAIVADTTTLAGLTVPGTSIVVLEIPAAAR